MPLNVGGNLATSRASFGPAVIAMDASGATPSTNIGLIGDDGCQIEFSSSMGDIRQGNPKLSFLKFVQSQDFFMRWTSIEWSANRLAYALGTGVTSISGTNEVLRFGGGPCPSTVALLLQHRKCTAAHTVNVRVWTATPENATIQTQMGDDVHGFPMAFAAQRSATNWAGGSLASDSQLVEVDIQLS